MFRQQVKQRVGQLGTAMRVALDDTPWHIVSALVILVLVSLVFVLSARLQDMQRVATELSAIRAEINGLVKERAADRAYIEIELNALYAQLWDLDAKQPSVVKAPAATRRTSAEAWSANRDKELRERIRALEEWRYRQER